MTVTCACVCVTVSVRAHSAYSQHMKMVMMMLAVVVAVMMMTAKHVFRVCERAHLPIRNTGCKAPSCQCTTTNQAIAACRAVLALRVYGCSGQEGRPGANGEAVRAKAARTQRFTVTSRTAVSSTHTHVIRMASSNTLAYNCESYHIVMCMCVVSARAWRCRGMHACML